MLPLNKIQIEADQIGVSYRPHRIWAAGQNRVAPPAREATISPADVGSVTEVSAAEVLNSELVSQEVET